MPLQPPLVFLYDHQISLILRLSVLLLLNRQSNFPNKIPNSSDNKQRLVYISTISSDLEVACIRNGIDPTIGLCVPPKVSTTWGYRAIIISREEITCCYLVHSKLVPDTGYSWYFTAKLARYPLPSLQNKPNPIWSFFR